MKLVARPAQSFPASAGHYTHRYRGKRNLLFVLRPAKGPASPLAGTVEPRLVTPPRNETKPLSTAWSLNRLVTIPNPGTEVGKESFVWQPRLDKIGPAQALAATSLHSQFVEAPGARRPIGKSGRSVHTREVTLISHGYGADALDHR